MIFLLNGKHDFIFSWGKQWGRKGYMKIAKDWNNHCGIASYAYYPTTVWVTWWLQESTWQETAFPEKCYSLFGD